MQFFLSHPVWIPKPKTRYTGEIAMFIDHWNNFEIRLLADNKEPQRTHIMQLAKQHMNLKGGFWNFI